MTFYGPHPQYTQVFLQEDAERCLEEARALKLKATVVLIQKRVSSRTTHKLLHVLGYIVYCTPKMHLCTNLTLSGERIPG